MHLVATPAKRQALFDRILSHFSGFAQGLGARYTRRRIWGPLQTFLTICMAHVESSSVSGCPWSTAINRLHKSAGEILGWGTEEPPSTRSFHTSRKKLAEMDDAHVWNQLLEHFTNAEHPEAVRVGRFRLLHGDGMQFHVPRSDETVRHFGVQHNGPCSQTHYPQGKLVLLLEGGSGLLVNHALVRCKDKATADHSDLIFEEKRAIEAFVEKMREDDCLVWDSGGASLQLFANMQTTGKHFLMAISKSWNLSRLARAQRKKDVIINYQIPKESFPQLARSLGSIRLRVVQIKDSKGDAKLLVTNILDELTLIQIRRAYRQRWSIETVFRYAKDYLGARILRSKSLPGIKQEAMAILAIIHLASYVQLLVVCEDNPIHDALSCLQKGTRRPRIRETFDLVLDLLLISHHPERCPFLLDRARKSFAIALRNPYIVQPGRSAERKSKSPHGFFKAKRDSRTQRIAKRRQAGLP